MEYTWNAHGMLVRNLLESEYLEDRVDEGSGVLWNVGFLPQHHTESQSGRIRLQYSPSLKPQISHEFCMQMYLKKYTWISNVRQ
jgi:hypothetical protein